MSEAVDSITLSELPDYSVRTEGPETLPDGTRVFTASFVELPQCLAQAETEDAARRRLWDGLPAYLHMLQEHGAAIPGPRPPQVQAVVRFATGHLTTPTAPFVVHGAGETPYLATR